MQMVMLIIQIFLYQKKKKTYHDVKNLETGNIKTQPRSTF